MRQIDNIRRDDEEDKRELTDSLVLPCKIRWEIGSREMAELTDS